MKKVILGIGAALAAIGAVVGMLIWKRRAH